MRTPVSCADKTALPRPLSHAKSSLSYCAHLAPTLSSSNPITLNLSVRQAIYSGLIRSEANVPLSDARALHDADNTAFGLACKGQGVEARFALRYMQVADYQAAAARLGLPDRSTLGRYRAQGVPDLVGLAGLLGLLENKGWQVSKVLYHHQEVADFLASAAGAHSEFTIKMPTGAKHSVHIRAMDAKARALRAAATQQQQQQQQQQLSSAASAQASAAVPPNPRPDATDAHRA
eukprot:5353885-Amphidinium_carterae.1